MSDYDDKPAEEADEAKTEKTAGSKKHWPDVLETARKRYDRGYQRERTNIDNALADLKFRRGEVTDQWTQDALDQRNGRPTVVLNLLPKFIRQVTGDMRQMRPGIKGVPVDSQGDIETAELMSGMFRYVENRSYAKHVYTTAADSQVAAGIGHWRVTSEYASVTTFNQELRILGIEDGVSVIWDVDSFMPTREDAGHCFVPIDYNTDTFKEKWPHAQATDFGVRATGDAWSSWANDDFVRVAEYWLKKPMKRSLVLMSDGSIDDVTDQTEGFSKLKLQGAAEFYRSKGARFEQRDSFKVCRYLMTCSEILEEQDWPGMHIPIVPAIGEEVRIGREVYRHGVVRYARDPQRMANYYASAEAEVVGLQPKAPWIGTEKQFANHLDKWETANTANHPFLEYTPDANAPGPPQRVMPPVASQAIQQGRMQASIDLQNVMGIYEGNLGNKSNETSGRAILARDQQSDTGTFVYSDNFSLAIQRTGQIVFDLIPHIYDTKRMMRIIGEDGKFSMKNINDPVVIDGIEKTMNDVTTGAYDVMIEPGPGYATKRQEAKESMTAFIQAFPQAAPLIGDIYAKVQDWPQSDEVGKRLEEGLPPDIKKRLQQERAEKERGPNDPPVEPAPPSPAEQMQQKGMELELADKQAKVEKTQAETAKIVKEIQAPPEGAQGDPSAMMQAQVDAQMGQIKLAAAEDDLKTQRQLNAIKIQKALAELHNAKTGIAIGAEKHVIDMVGKASNLMHGAEKHEAGMFQQHVGMVQGEEKHSATIERMNKPEAVQ